MYIDVILTHKNITPQAVERKNCVVIDTLRATSTIITAFAHGCREIVPVKNAATAFRLKRRRAYQDYILAGEREGYCIENFQMGNSPQEYSNDRLKGKGIIFCTTNGTKALIKTKKARATVICALLNVKTVAQWLRTQCFDTVICCAGTGGSYSMEDFLTAGRLVGYLQEKNGFLFSDLASTAAFVYENIKEKSSGKNSFYEVFKNTANGKKLLAAGLESDTKYCAQEDIFPLLPIFKNGSIALQENPPIEDPIRGEDSIHGID